MIKKVSKSKFLAFYLILSFLLLITAEATPNTVDLETNKEFKPVVRVKESEEEIPASQKNRFKRLIEEGKKLFQEEMDYEAAEGKFKEAQTLAITRAQEADVLFYLSLVYYATAQERGTEEFDETIRKLIEIDYYREPDLLLCPPRYIVLFQGIKKEYGVLRIQSKPAGADVYLNDSNVPAGKTPLTIGAKAGSVKIRVKKGNKEKKEILTVVAGKETASSLLALKGGSSLLLIIGGIALAGGGAAAFLGGGKKVDNGPKYGSIQVNSTPAGATVYLDGNNTGQTTNCTLTNVSPGNHTINLYKEGYEDCQESASVTAGQTATLNINLTQIIITVPEITSDTIWTTGNEVEIKWNTSTSTGSQGNVSSIAGLNSALHPRRNLLSSLRRRALRHRHSSRNFMNRRGEQGSTGSVRSGGMISIRSPNSQDVSKKFSSSSKGVKNFPQGTKNIGIDKKRSSAGRINFPIALGISPQISSSFGEIRALDLTNVKIDLYKGTSLVQVIAASTENDGSYMWTVPSSLASGTDYKVRISCVSDSTVYGESDEFTIEDKSLTVTEPASNTIWPKGYSADISWTSEGTINNVKIDLYKGTTFNQTIVPSTANDGSYTWTAVDPSLADDSDYKIRITDASNSSVYDESEAFQIATSGHYEFLTKWGSFGSGDSQFDWPSGVEVDNVGYVYVVDMHNNRVQKFTSSGSFVTEWGSYGTGNSQFDYPARVAVDSSGDVYVSDQSNHRIQKFTSDGTYLTQWGSLGAGDGYFDQPIGIAIDSSDYVYVADEWNDRIQKFTSSGSFVTKWGTFGTGDGQFNLPFGIAIDSSGYVLVTDSQNDRVQKFTSDGDFVTKWGSSGTGDGQFDIPHGITVDSSGYVYVCDAGNDRIQKFQYVSSTLGVTKKSFKSIDNNLANNKNSKKKPYDLKSPMQNRLKNQKNKINIRSGNKVKQINRKAGKSEELINREDKKSGKK